MKRLWPVIVLYLLSPLIAEYLSGSMSMAQLGQLLVLLPLYGSGAVLVREVAHLGARGGECAQRRGESSTADEGGQRGDGLESFHARFSGRR